MVMNRLLWERSIIRYTNRDQLTGAGAARRKSAFNRMVSSIESQERRSDVGFALSVYRALTSLARPAAGLILRHRERRGKEDPARRGERLGEAAAVRPEGVLAWCHAASVGETNAILPLIGALIEARPDLRVLLTTGTVTSAQLAAGRLPPGAVHQYVPLDAAEFVGKFLDYWRPSLAVFTEQEIWPNLLFESHARGIPLALVNARMSQASFERWQRRPRLASQLFSRFDLVLAQSDVLARQFSELGAPRALVAGNLKIDAPPPPVNDVDLKRLEAVLARRPVLVAASTHDGEEAIVASAHRILAGALPGFMTILAPRHPERGAVIADMLQAQGLAVARRSLGHFPTADTQIYVADTIGELGTLYALAPIAFIGGSLVERGGQNPIEAIRHGAAVLTGPHWSNFADAYGMLMERGGACVVTSADALAATVLALRGDPARLDAVRTRAAEALMSLSGAQQRTLDALLRLIPAGAGTGLKRAS
jgi:3-deoxy-D-manno-octulosonic-acid transferase